MERGGGADPPDHRRLLAQRFFQHGEQRPGALGEADRRGHAGVAGFLFGLLVGVAALAFEFGLAGALLLDRGLEAGDGLGELLYGEDALGVGGVLAEDADELLGGVAEHDYVGARVGLEGDQHGVSLLYYRPLTA